MRASGAEGKLNRFIRACKREPACKAALSLWCRSSIRINRIAQYSYGI
jgi:hypothetical protein